MIKSSSYWQRNPITFNLLIVSVTLLIVYFFLRFAVFSGIKRGELYGEIQSTHQKLYVGGKASGGVEERAKFITEFGEVLEISCKVPCKESTKVKVSHYTNLFGKDIYEFNGI